MARRIGPGAIRTLAVRFEDLPKKIRRGPRDVNLTSRTHIQETELVFNDAMLQFRRAPGFRPKRGKHH